MEFHGDDTSSMMMTEDYSYFLTNDTHKYLTASSSSSSSASNDSFLLLDEEGTNINNNNNLTGAVAPQSRDEELAKIEIAILALIFSFTVLGNFIVILGIYFRRQKMSRMYYFILHLSIADLITAFFNVLTQLIWELTWHFQGGNILCKFIKYAQILGPYSSSYVLVVTAIDRYQAICFPLSNCTWTARRSKLMLAFAWTLSILLCVPQLFIFSYMETSPGIEDCWATFVDGWGAKAYVTWYAITVFIIPLIILIFSYSCICRAIWINFSMKNSIRRHQFSRSSRISRDSETENEFCHSMSLVDNNSCIDNNSSSGSGGGGILRHSRRSVNSSIRRQVPPFVPLAKNLEVSWNRSGSGGGGGGGDGGGQKPILGKPTTITTTPTATTTMTTLTTSFSNTNTSGGGGPNQILDLIRYHPPHHMRRGRYASSPPDPGETDEDDSGMDEQKEEDELDFEEEERRSGCPSSTSSPPRLHPPTTSSSSPLSMDKVQMFPNGGAKYSSPAIVAHSDEKRVSPLLVGYKLNRNGSNSKNSSSSSPLNNKQQKQQQAEVKTRTYVWFSTKNSKVDKNNRTAAVVAAAAPIDINGDGHQHQQQQQSSSSELNSGNNGNNSGGGGKPRRTFAQFLLARTKNLHNNSQHPHQHHMIVSKGSEVDRFRSSHTTNSSSASFRQQPPRSSSVKGISRAKIKTVKLTVTVICCYIFCSSPFIAAQLWSTYDPYASESPFWTGATFTILTLLASLNSCVNPWIFLFFNPNLLQDFLKGFGCSHFIPKKHQKKKAATAIGNHSPHSATQRTTVSQGLIS